MSKSKYYLFLDECGDQNLANFDSQFPVFVLCGIIVSSDKLKLLNEQIDELKLKFWGKNSVILHSRDIRKCDKDFKILFDNNVKEEFYRAVNSIMAQNDVYVIVCCGILKEPYIRQLGKLNDVYAQSLSFVLERTVFYLDTVNKSDGIDLNIIAEQRGKKEDKNLNLFYSSLLDNGTYWVKPERLRDYCHKFEFKPKSHNINGLQIADLIAYPIARHILNPEKDNPAYSIIEGNIYHEGSKIMGLKILP